MFSRKKTFVKFLLTQVSRNNNKKKLFFLYTTTMTSKEFAHRIFNEHEFNVSQFQKELNTNLIGRGFIYRKETESTMLIGKREISERGLPGTLILAESQTQGKGRRGRSWSSPPNKKFVFFDYLED